MAIGFFVLSGFMALLFLAFRVSGGSALYSSVPSYEFSVEFSNIGRLKNQSKVAIAGVTIGRVTGIELNPETFEAIVNMDILAQYNQIPEDSQFSIVTAGLLGDNYIIVSPGFSSTVLKPGSQIDSGQTSSALVLEELIGKLMTSFSSSSHSPDLNQPSSSSSQQKELIS